MDRAKNDKSLNLNHDSVHTMLPSRTFALVRAEMLNGVEPAACTRCYDTERSGLQSKREYEIESHFVRNEVFDTELLEPTFVELRLGNLCNLQCVTCNPVSSRLLSKTFDQMTEIQFVDKAFINMKIDDSWTENHLFWDDLLSERDHLQKFYINGGEPTLIAQHWRFLAKLIELDAAKNIELRYNINVTNMKQEYIDTWKQFKLVSVGCSIDDLTDRNHFIRYPASWPILMKNLNMLIEQGITVEITQTISIMNVYYLDEFCKFFGDMNIPIALNYVHDPSYLSIFNMPVGIKNKIITKLEPTLAPHYMNNLRTSIDVARENITEFNNGITYLHKVARLRNLNLLGTFPELFKLIDDENNKNT